jgi:two-component system NtrC family sensor kinase
MARAERSSPHRLRWQIVTALLLAAVAPLALLAGGAWVVFGRMIEDRAVALQRTLVHSHAASIEAYIARLRALLQLSAATLDPQTSMQALGQSFETINRVSDNAFVDLGIIAENGGHLAYVGPYDLAAVNYHGEEWFREAMVRGVFVSDVFLGYRRVPHFVIVIRQRTQGRAWLLRATVSSARFESLVATPEAAETFLVNSQGLLQTRAVRGAVLDRVDLTISLDRHEGVVDRRAVIAGRDSIIVTTWLNDGRWLLVVLQDAAQVRSPVRRALLNGAVVVLVAFAAMVATTVLATRHLTRQIERADREREEMSRAFMRSARLASVGELATGLAHEINNPLAIISAEQTNISDLLPGLRGDDAASTEIRESVERIGRQVRRCGSITAKMLQFGRSRDTALEATDLKTSLHSIVSLLERQAGVRNIDLVLSCAEDVPRVLLDPVELEQVIVNLINNSFAALANGGRIMVRTRRLDDAAMIEVEDNGAGMPPEVRDRIFEPFFTTKAVGQGTGLGLSVCYGLVQSWGGTIEVESEAGRGTTIRICLPPTPAGDPS